MPFWNCANLLHKIAFGESVSFSCVNSVGMADDDDDDDNEEDVVGGATVGMDWLGWLIIMNLFWSRSWWNDDILDNPRYENICSIGVVFTNLRFLSFSAWSLTDSKKYSIAHFCVIIV